MGTGQSYKSTKFHEITKLHKDKNAPRVNLALRVIFAQKKYYKKQKKHN